VLVFALERMGQATTSQQVFNTIFDPVYEKDFPLTTITMAALRASMLMRLYGYTEHHWAKIASRSYQNARRNPLAHLHLDVSPEDVLKSPLLAWPIHRYEACPMSEGACAMVLVAKDSIGARKPGLGPGLRVDVGQLRDGRSHHRPEATLVDLLSLRCPPKRPTRKPASRIPSRRSASSSSIPHFQAPKRWPTLPWPLQGGRRPALCRETVHGSVAAGFQSVRVDRKAPIP
jgi:acetyl-CoA C-acetyltransferase